ncbi:XrtA system polysaccharide chain length determinant [Thalassotalea sp. PP2-459]|uniref:XrtA system polysaccharide chain length determinant n=1 Tax=Thalassotalea sp. PP2-459 TaxID=1742724 RepID=UPI00094323BD|nr:XrtA system polysaccharide chain length determinant [Thalassotalea sp. PP2-459]OKY26703.1 chain length determinant family protein [Thalassotalea sp. PP2-459]
MQEIIEQALDYLKGIWLKRRYIIVATWMICPLAWVIISQMDDVYESEAKVYADTQSILGPLLRGLTVQTDPDKQISYMVRTLLSRENLERITRMTDLDVQVQTSDQYEALINTLKNGIEIRKAGRENYFTISYQDKDPEMAKNVVQSALTVFIENTLGENRSESDTAQKFLDTQIKEYENRLLADEAKLTEFKQKYSEVLPNQYGGYYSKLNNAKESLKSIELILSETQSQLKNAIAQLGSNKADSTDRSNAVVDSNTVNTSYDDRIVELESMLDSLLLKYTEQHPDVKEVQNRLAHLNKQRKKEIDEYLTARSDSSSLSLSQNPVIQNLQIQINQLENQIASIKVRRDNYAQEVKDLENKIHILPEIEAQLTGLNRGYEITKTKYEELLKRKETAQLAKQADETTSKINFRVIDQPRAPKDPSGPPRILFLIGSTILAFGVGLGLSLLVSQINPVVTSRNQVTRETGIPVFGIVSATENLGLQKWNKKKTLIFIASNSVLVCLLILFILYAMFPEQIQAPLKGML